MPAEDANAATIISSRNVVKPETGRSHISEARCRNRAVINNGIPKKRTSKPQLADWICIQPPERVFVLPGSLVVFGCDERSLCRWQVCKVRCIDRCHEQLWRIACEEPQTISDNSSTQVCRRKNIRSTSLFRIEVLGGLREIVVRYRTRRKPRQERTLVTIEFRHFELQAKFAVIVVSTATGDNADHTTRRTTVDSIETT